MSYDLAVIYRGGPYLVRSFVNVAGSCDYSFVRQKNDIIDVILSHPGCS